MGHSPGETNQRHSTTQSNLHQETVSVSEDTLGSEKCTPAHIQQTPVSIRDQHSKKRPDSENVNIAQKRKQSSQKEESPAGNTKENF